MPDQTGDITLRKLRCEYLQEPIGIDETRPRLSWEIEADRHGVTQHAYQIQVAEDESALETADNILWDSGLVESGKSVNQPYDGPTLQPRERYHWRVRIRDETGTVTKWSSTATFEIGLLNSEAWTAEWIEPEIEEQRDDEQPAPFLRREFQTDTDRQIRSARVYATAHGLFELSLNGERIGDDVFSPGWTSYYERLQYRTFDITSTVQEGENAIGAILGDGWWRGKVGGESKTEVYGTELAFLAQVHIEYEDGTERVIGTDSEWEATDGPIRSSDFKDGEIYDARLEIPGWNKPGFGESWCDVSVVEHTKDTLIATEAPPVRRQKTVEPERIIETPSGQTVVDMGQNFAGRVRLNASGPRGTTLRLRHGEALDADGNFSMDHLGNEPVLEVPQQEVRYTFRGAEGTETYEPRFTYHGFRYVLVEGFPGTPSTENFTGIALYSDLSETSEFECSDDRLNQLQQNIRWSQRSNFVDIPTDCPQRERSGWTGDVQIFARTASFNMETAPFFRKWLRDLTADQRSNGCVPNYTPDPTLSAGNPSRIMQAIEGSAGWGDAAVITPWVMFERYGDRRLLANQYESMQLWVEYMRNRADRTAWYKVFDPRYWTDTERRNREPFVWDTDYHWGEWLEPDDEPGMDPVGMVKRYLFGVPEVATAYFAYSTGLLAETADELDRPEDATRYRELSETVKDAFVDEFVSENGRIGADKQASYVRALAFDLLPEHLRSTAADRLVQLIKQNGNKLGTGFLSTVHLLPVLAEEGYPDVAYDVLLQDEIPSWLYEVEQGATTIWECWDGIEPNGEVNESLNHYSPGAVGEFLYEYVAGLRPAAPGYKEIEIRPVFGGGLTSASATYESVYGRIKSEWKLSTDSFEILAEIPANTDAVVTVPGAAEEDVTINGEPAATCTGVRSVEGTTDGIDVEVGSGEYRFEYSTANK